MDPALKHPTWESIPPHAYTEGEAVTRISTLAGLAPDPEQGLILTEGIFAHAEDGTPSAFEVAAIAGRQNLKTATMMQAVLGWLFVESVELITWSSHEMTTSRKSHEILGDLIQGCGPLRRRLPGSASHGITSGNDHMAIELADGRQVLFKARTGGGGRGLSGDKIILDEGLFLRSTHLGSLIPTLSTRPGAQIFYGSSAGKPISEVLRDLRARGRKGGDPDLAYFEWGDPRPQEGCASLGCTHVPGVEGCALDDLDRIRLANPALGRRISVAYVRRERKAIPPDEFARERLGWWEDPIELVEIFGEGKWKACGVAPGASEIVSDLVLGLAVSHTREFACIGAAGRNAEGLMHLEPITYARGTDWLVEQAAELAERHGAPVVLDGGGPAADLKDDLEAAGVKVETASTRNVLDACADLFDEVGRGEVAHMNYPELDSAVSGAQWRPVGDRRALGRKTSVFDITPLEAVNLAAWGSRAGLVADYDVLDSVF